MNHHQQALEYISKYKFGCVREISRKIPWGFHKSLRLDNYTVESFLKSYYNFYHTTILHILSGEGESLENIEKCIDKSIKESFRVLILEHNPDSPDWNSQKKNFSDKINHIEKKLEEKRNIKVTTVYIGENVTSRNKLYVISTIPILTTIVCPRVISVVLIVVNTQLVKE